MVSLYNVTINTACLPSSKLLHPKPASVNLISGVMRYNLMESALQGVPLSAF